MVKRREERQTFLLGFVSKHRTKSDVPDAFNAFDRGVELVVDDDSAFVVFFYTDRF